MTDVVPSHPRLPRRSPAVWWVATLALPLLVGGVVYWSQLPRSQPPPQAVVATTSAPATRPALPPVGVVTDAARQLKLITWSFETTVDAATISDKWYGDVTATVRAPVRYQYGLDLATLREESVFFDALGRRFVFLVDEPKRLSAEVDVARLEHSLDASGMRWASRNSSELDRARIALGERANALQLSPEDEDRLRTVSREQLERHLTTVLRGDAPVVVRFAR